MPKRTTDPITDEKVLTHREKMSYIANGGNGQQAAIAAGHRAARADHPG